LLVVIANSAHRLRSRRDLLSPARRLKVKALKEASLEGQNASATVAICLKKTQHIKDACSISIPRAVVTLVIAPSTP
jgi:hypothetical protein